MSFSLPTVPFHWLALLKKSPMRLARRLSRRTNPYVSFAKVSLEHFIPVHAVDDRYLSFSIDISVLAGGYWWEGATNTRGGLGTVRVPPINLKNKKLDLLVSKLGPAFLRVGGSEADKIHYFQAPQDEKNCLVLTKDQWDQLHEFIRRNELKLSFTFKYGLFKRKHHGKWRASEVETLLRYAQQNNQTIDVCELGNELNAYWAFHGITAQPRAKNLAVDYHEFTRTILAYMPDAKIIGPGSAFWPKLGETIKPFSNITENFLKACQNKNTPIHIVDWHYYPFQSLRSPVRTRAANVRAFLKPRSLNDFKKYADGLRNLQAAYIPNASIWTGETGSAQCGGEPKLSDRFISCFWWADQLGQGALCHQSVMIRQSLIGGEYGLIDRLTLKPRPDYWLSWLWKQLMGQSVYKVNTEHHLLRTYCHDTPYSSGKTLLLINLSARTLDITTKQMGDVQQQYVLTAKRLRSKRVHINGVKAKFKQGAFCLDDFKSHTVSYRLPGHSISFWLIH